MATTNGKKRELTLKDYLSRLGYRRACQLIGEEGEKLIAKGGKYSDISIDDQVRLDDEQFRLQLNGTQVTITFTPEARNRLRWQCSDCTDACEHVGAAFSLILEEKTALGLAAPPPERTVAESLSEQELVRQAIEERQERARSERMKIKPVNPGVLWSDYPVTNAESGRTYRVALRGWEPGDSYCSCPDFRKNTLGICKHVLRVQTYARKQFSAATCRRPFEPKEIAVHFRYGHDAELRLLLPRNLDASATKILGPLARRAIEDVGDLLARVRKLEAAGQPVTIYPDAEEYINQRLIQERIGEKMAGIRGKVRTHPLRKELLKQELLPYQLDGVAFAVGAGRAILADDMGLGKTIQGIGVAELLAREAGIKRTLIVCPASLKSQWRSEIHRFSDRDVQLVMGSTQGRARQYANDVFFTVCNYEQVLRDILAIEPVKWDLIILDEGQRIKNWETQTSRIVKGLRSPFALVLSGTPLENRLDDLFSVAEFIDDRRLGPAFRFFNRHRIVDDKGKVLGYKNLDALRAQLAPILLRRTRASVMQDLPPRTTEIVRVRPTEEQLGVHVAHMRIVSSIVRKPFISEMDLLRLQKSLLMCRMVADSTFLVDKEPPGYSTKLEALGELLDKLFAEEDRKAVLFSEWTTMLGLIEPMLKSRGIEYVRLDGSVPQKLRQGLVEKFRRDPACRMFITTNAGSTGLNLQAANTIINIDLPWNPAVLEQRIARAHRMGQKRPVQVYVLLTEETIEENLLTTLGAKQQLALAALDAESDVDKVDLASGIDELKRRLEVLLGTKPEAPTDISLKIEKEREADRLARQDRVAAAGGQFLTAALTLLTELLPADKLPKPSDPVVDGIKKRLSDCVQTDEQGRPRFVFTLPDASVLDRAAQAVACLAGTLS